MDHILADARSRLPLDISQVETDAVGLRISGPNWHLRVNTAWRIVSNEPVAAALPNSQQALDAQPLIDELVGRQVVRLHLEYHGDYGDICLTMDNGHVFEMLSDMPYGEWLLSIWRLGDTRRTPIYDLPGPCAWSCVPGTPRRTS
ncbi:hypothetical protein [Streptacidiphilus sp. PAMC 29251]